MLSGVAAGFAFGGFGDGVGEFGQGFGGANAYAGRDADPLLNTPADLARAFAHVTAYATQIDKAFIDAVDLLSVAQACGHRRRIHQRTGPYQLFTAKADQAERVGRGGAIYSTSQLRDPRR